MGSIPIQASKEMDNPKAVVRTTPRYGQGVFAKESIYKGEVIAEFDGEVYSWRSTRWTEELYDHAIQFERYRWRDSKGIARLLNHSCEPNCGIKNLFQVVAMRNIKKGEEITWDYEMTENHPWWRMHCHCGTPSCRKLIGAYDNMPTATRKRYKGYISAWLLKKKYVLPKTGGLLRR